MIDVKQAVKIAVNYVADILGPENVEDPRIEEVELSDSGDKWSITVGYFPPSSLGRLAWSPLLPRPKDEREYKQVQIENGWNRKVDEDEKP